MGSLIIKRIANNVATKAVEVAAKNQIFTNALSAVAKNICNECKVECKEGICPKCNKECKHNSNSFGSKRKAFLHERLLELFARQPEGDVHPRAARLVGRPSVETGTVDLRVERRRLALVVLADCVEAALGQRPFHDEPHQVNAEARRRVVHRSVLGVNGVVQHRVERLARARQQVFANDHQRYA